MCKNKSEKRKMCIDCPWGNNYSNKEDWLKMIQMALDSGLIKDKVHRCHEIDDVNTWDESNESNVCIGSLK